MLRISETLKTGLSVPLLTGGGKAWTDVNHRMQQPHIQRHSALFTAATTDLWPWACTKWWPSQLCL